MKFNGLIVLRLLPLFLVLVITVVSFAGCQVIGDIFKAGFWAGVILVVIILAIVLWIVAKTKR
jgi:uncharacterized membrane protein YkvI